jgi:hypothetical protein
MTRTWTLPTPRGDSRKDKVTCFMRQDGRCGCGCGAKLQVKGYILEHIVPLEDGGADDLSNKAAYAIPCAKAKTKAEAAARAKSRRVRDKHIGAFPKKSRPIPGSKASGLRKRFDGTVERR